MRLSAGADWLMVKKSIVNTYELTSVTMDKDWDEGTINLEDRYNALSVGLGWLRMNQALWDLVYNGIQHSVVRGADVNRMAVDQLQLHDVVAMRERHGRP